MLSTFFTWSDAVQSSDSSSSSPFAQIPRPLSLDQVAPSSVEEGATVIVRTLPSFSSLPPSSWSGSYDEEPEQA